MKNKKVYLVVEPINKPMDRAFSVLERRSKNNKEITIISFPDSETLRRVIAGTRLEILKCVRKKQPHSIQELSLMVNRDFINVYQDVMLLAVYGLIELKEAGPRKSAEPLFKFSEIILAATGQNILNFERINE